MWSIWDHRPRHISKRRLDIFIYRRVCTGRTLTIATFHIHSYKLNNNNKHMSSDVLKLFRAQTKNLYNEYVLTCSYMFRHVGTQLRPELLLGRQRSLFRIFCVVGMCWSYFFLVKSNIELKNKTIDLVSFLEKTFLFQKKHFCFYSFVFLNCSS